MIIKSFVDSYQSPLRDFEDAMRIRLVFNAGLGTQRMVSGFHIGFS